MIDDAAIKRARILIADDQEANITLLERLLEVSDFTNVVTTTDSSQVVTLCAEVAPDLVLLDLHMPFPDGFEVMSQLGPWIQGPTRLPVLVLTADATPDAKRRALTLGATDFLTKPFDNVEVVLRVKNLLLTRLLQVELRNQNRELDRRVRARTRELEEARIEALERLAFAAEYRDDATGGHPERVGRIASLVAAELGLPDETVELMRRAAPLHDVGKIAIPDAILLKRGQLAPDEFEAMKMHVTVGVEILGRSRSRLLQLAEEIARTHHERWDGTGYPLGLKGEEIPLSGRVVAVVDAFDSLVGARPHTRAATPEQARAAICDERERHFDPQVVDAFTALPLEVLAARAAPVEPAVSASV